MGFGMLSMACLLHPVDPESRSAAIAIRERVDTLRETSGKVPKPGICSLPRTLNLSRHQRLPAGSGASEGELLIVLFPARHNELGSRNIV
jgi:hypothetical protein